MDDRYEAGDHSNRPDQRHPEVAESWSHRARAEPSSSFGSYFHDETNELGDRELEHCYPSSHRPSSLVSLPALLHSFDQGDEHIFAEVSTRCCELDIEKEQCYQGEGSVELAQRRNVWCNVVVGHCSYCDDGEGDWCEDHFNDMTLFFSHTIASEVLHCKAQAYEYGEDHASYRGDVSAKRSAFNSRRLIPSRIQDSVSTTTLILRVVLPRHSRASIFAADVVRIAHLGGEKLYFMKETRK